MLHKIVIFFALCNALLLLPGIVSAYVVHEPIVIRNIQATQANPYILEGYEISNPQGTCIEVINSKNVIIRNNYLHNCGTDKGFQKQTDHYQEGYATLVGNSSDIVFENNVLDNNFRGFMAYNTPRLKATRNKITNTLHYSPLWCEVCSNSEFSFNYLSDNGNPMHFWVPGDRSIGIWIKRSDNVEIYDNTVIRSTSDGISVTGHIYTPSFTAQADPNMPHPQADWGGNCNNINIYNNLILDNLEQGVWLVNARNVSVYDNVIRTGCFTHGTSIFSEFNVGDSNFYNNKILGCLGSVISGAYSFNINVYDNSFYSHYDETKGDFMFFRDQIEDVVALAHRQGANYQESKNNHQRNNKRFFVGGSLAKEMIEKIRYAHKNKTYEMQGWMACTKEGGGVDEECVKKEEFSGEIGVPAEQLLYSSLMDNFDDFVVDQPIIVDKEDKAEKNNYFQFFLLAVAIVFLGIEIILWKKR